MYAQVACEYIEAFVCFNLLGLKLWQQAADKLAPAHGNLAATFLKQILRVYTDVISFAVERILIAHVKPS